MLSGSAARQGTGNALNNRITGSEIANLLDGGDGNDTLDGGAGDDTLIGGSGADSLVGGSGNDTYLVDSSLDRITEQAGAGTDTVISSVSWTLGANLENLTLSGSALTGNGNTLDNIIIGNALANTLAGQDGNDWIDGGSGDSADTLLGGAGNDTLVGNGLGTLIRGGTGNDVISARTGAATILFDRGDGQDTIGSRPDTAFFANTLQFGAGIAKADVDVRVSGNDLVLGLRGTTDTVTLQQFYAPSPFSGADIGTRMTGAQIVRFADGSQWTLEDLKAIVFAGTASNDSIRGSFLADTISGGAGSDLLEGFEGNDWLDGGLGSNTIDGGSGNDTLIGSYNEDDLLFGGDGNDSLHGLQGNDSLYGGAGNDTLRGNMGSLTFHGGAGNDMLQTGGMGSMTAYFGRGDGQDTIGGHADWANPANTLQFTGNISKGDIELSVVNKNLVLSIRGTTDSVTIDQFYNSSHPSGEGFNIGGGMSGVQQVRFADGSSWTLDDLKTIIFSGTTANDTITGSFRDDMLYGGSGNDTLAGRAGNDWLDGGTGADWLVGGSGNDTYIVDSLQDGVFESPYDFMETDTVISSVSGWTLGTNVENLILTGQALTGTGNELANVITGNDLANTIYGLDGNDWLDGGYGSNTIDGGAGNDTIIGSMIHADSILGGDGNDSINGGFEGADTILGGAGNDTISANGNAMITGGTGNDVLRSLGASTFVFNRGDGQDVIGARTDTAFGNNTLQFGASITQADVAVTLSGNDLVLSLRGTTDSVTLNMYRNPWVPMQGADLGGRLSGAQIVRFADGSQWGPDALRTLALTGTAGNDSIRGSYLADTLSGMEGSDTLLGYEGDDWLDGGSWMDVMYGGTGNDTYVVNHMYDQTIEFASEGTDTVISSVTEWTLNAHVENLTMIGSAWFGYGNASANVIVGSQRSNELYGLDGDDTIYGMGGNDTIIGGAGNNQVYGGDGNDTVAGNDGNDLLSGDSGDDRLYAGGGQNTLQGGTGNDTIWAGAGADTYLFSRGDGIDLVVESQNAGAASDQLLFQSGIGHDQLWLSRSGNNLQISVIGTSDQVTIQDWYLGQAGHVEQIRTSTGRVLLDTKVDALVSAMAAMVPPAAGQTSLTAGQQMLLAPVLAASWS
ncbi:calcium-binding protein [Sphaerotilus sulfidivorans]|uniref:calcium-binding protein n=1 Tax=Sphaerotilus sulfidivorans TaxID=639200 RepID=UPI001C5CAED4|nr:calcium-binding protein [Sphaerotilus sulfidivorans]